MFDIFFDEQTTSQAKDQAIKKQRQPKKQSILSDRAKNYGIAQCQDTKDIRETERSQYEYHICEEQFYNIDQLFIVKGSDEVILINNADDYFIVFKINDCQINFENLMNYKMLSLPRKSVKTNYPNDLIKVQSCHQGQYLCFVNQMTLKIEGTVLSKDIYNFNSLQIINLKQFDTEQNICSIDGDCKDGILANEQIFLQGEIDPNQNGSSSNISAIDNNSTIENNTMLNRTANSDDEVFDFKKIYHFGFNAIVVSLILLLHVTYKIYRTKRFSQTTHYLRKSSHFWTEDRRDRYELFNDQLQDSLEQLLPKNKYIQIIGKEDEQADDDYFSPQKRSNTTGKNTEFMYQQQRSEFRQGGNIGQEQKQPFQGFRGNLFQDQNKANNSQHQQKRQTEVYNPPTIIGGASFKKRLSSITNSDEFKQKANQRVSFKVPSNKS
ncbi:UNKNOWN [Stylonychia lemnae]|uniref:Transmembrane protein n=1 Tax=Stylonychia lemnae TaxID=5949 RepID=A0A078AHY8_STYLE|nr:UNKNOWN [Stylonychia lemnae]|eukprot:CDW81536.1 UNKNOWN [Stylonychia lemnae]